LKLTRLFEYYSAFAREQDDVKSTDVPPLQRAPVGRSIRLPPRPNDRETLRQHRPIPSSACNKDCADSGEEPKTVTAVDVVQGLDASTNSP